MKNIRNYVEHEKINDDVEDGTFILFQILNITEMILNSVNSIIIQHKMYD